MLNNSIVWFISRGVVLATWLILIAFALVIPGKLMLLARIALLGLFLIHLLEIPLSLSIGKEKGLTTFRTAMKTLLFGFTWWIPLRKGIIDE